MLDALELRNIHESSDEEIGFSCPFPGHERGDENPSAFMNRYTTAFICFSCGRKGGNAAKFVSDYEEISYTQALTFLRQAYGNEFAEPQDTMVNEWNTYFKGQPKEASEEEEQVLSEDTLDLFKEGWKRIGGTYMYDRGFVPDTLSAWDIGYDRYSKRYTIPVRNEHGKLVGFKGRSWNGAEPKYLVLGDRKYPHYGFRPYKVHDYLFGLWKCSSQPTHMVVCEGELDTIALHQAGYEAVGLGGSQISDKQISLLKRANSLILFLDNDKAGNRAAFKIADQLQSYIPTRIVPDHEGDPASLVQAEVQKLIENSESSLTIIGD